MHKGHKQVSQKSQYLHITNDVDEKNKEVPFFFFALEEIIISIVWRW